VEAVDSEIGLLPTEGGIETEGLDVSPAAMAELLSVDTEGWSAQLPQVHAHYATFGDKLPPALRDQLSALEQRLES
jgi:phosphoenolpyruvate carboxykinase (GTP)